ncbi:MAG: hypothetical protein JWQ27_2702 [Ferruginibacter sp.]|nr:hypothetical protein [Ferruginibacter sp.]
MDGLKLVQWQQSFLTEVKQLQPEYDAFLLERKFSDTYRLTIDATSQSVILWLDSSYLPKELEDRLTELLLATKPEDSV